LCKICGRMFNVAKAYRYSYCSAACRAKGKAARHREYVRRNREHLRDYNRTRYARIWGVSNRGIAKDAETLARKKLLPSLGFTEIYHASADRRYIPFDLVATVKDRRVLVDITTGKHKGGRGSRIALEIARALQMPLLRVFIKPDFSGYMIRDARDGGAALLDMVRHLPQ